ncbi:hypothetical protein [Leptolyngbya subtilissima]|uniref:hypothetical protein n=1 Tax=Leptolyngbya subtilissima TaxID=1346803 RepID=UPI00329732EF
MTAKSNLQYLVDSKVRKGGLRPESSISSEKIRPNPGPEMEFFLREIYSSRTRLAIVERLSRTPDLILAEEGKLSPPEIIPSKTFWYDISRQQALFRLKLNL